MIVDDKWIDDEEWLEQQSLAVYEAIQNVQSAVESGDLSQYRADIFRKYVEYYAEFRSPDQFWNSSSAYC